ncbi:MAG: hypothetical protein NTY19_50880 [Planctomycetota bacterium]|nr:hypothetical protein [Planctomycetota bacterium]
MSWTFKEKLDDKLANAAKGLKFIEPPTKVEFKIEVKFDAKIEKEALKDPLLRKEFDDAAIDTINRFVELIKRKMEQSDKEVEKLVNANLRKEAEDYKSKMNKDIEQMRTSAQQFGVQQVEQAWKELQAKRKEYKNYKIKIGVTIGATIAGMATSIGLMVSAPFTGGASAAIGIIGLIKSAVTVAKEIVMAGMEVETAAKELGKQLNVVEDIWKKSKSAGGHANEISGTLLTQFLGQSQPTIKACVSEMDRVNKKLTGLEVKNHDLAKTIEKTKGKISELFVDFNKEVKKRLEKHPSGKGPEQIAKIEKQFHNAVDAAVEAVQETGQKLLSDLDRVKAAKTTAAELQKRVVAIAKFRGGAYTILDNVLLGTGLLLTPLDGNKLVTGAVNVVKSVVPTAGGFVIDRLTKLALEGTMLE